MDFSAIYQIRAKASLWIDAAFYLAISLLLASVLSYGIFLIKNGMQRNEIIQKTAALREVGTIQQKEQEKFVLSYQQKIKDFSEIFQNHEFASQVFPFLQQQALANTWFSQFNLDRKSAKVQLFGQTDTMDDLGRQVALFERSQYVKSVSALSSALANSSKIQFTINLILDPKLFGFKNNAN